MQKVLWQKIGDFKVSNISLGKGQSCEVFYAVNQNTMEKVAAKRININKVTAKLEKQLENQIKNLTKVSSPFIVKLYGYLRYQNQKQNQSYLYIFLEFCDQIDMKKYLDQSKKKGLPQAQALLFLRHIVEGYKQLYENNILHRDIKPANILLKQGVAKLSDFGFSREVEDPQKPKTYTLLGTPLYTAPQILDRRQFSSKCDVWSVGVMLYEMLYGRTPWIGKDLNDLLENIKKKPLQFGQLNRRPELKELLRKMLKVNQEQRISWKEIFEHPLFKQQLTIKPLPKAVSYKEYKQIYLDYLKNNIVILFYLRNSVKEVTFKDEQLSVEQTISKTKQYREKISRKLTHKRNLAFLYAYILFLYYNNTDIIQSPVNSGMQFQFALAKRAFNKISELGKNYINKDPTQYSQQQWKRFKVSSDFEQFHKILDADYNLLHKLIQQISTQAHKRYKNGQITPEIAQLIKNIDNPGVFEKIMELNKNLLLKNSKTGVCGLIAFYIDYAVNPETLDNDIFQFGSFYQKRQRQYGLN